jgi:hypothetical protein
MKEHAILCLHALSILASTCGLAIATFAYFRFCRKPKPKKPVESLNR